MKATKIDQRPIINMDPMVPSINTNLWEEQDLDMPMGELANSHQNILLDPQLFHPMLNPDPSPFSTFQYSSLPPNSPNCHKEEEKEEEEDEEAEEEEEKLGAMKEMMYRIAAMQPVDIDPETIKRPQRKNVRISDDPQSVAARQRRERISDRIRILRSLVPGGTKMDIASMLDEAVSYVKFLKRQVHLLKRHHRHQQSSQIPAPPCVIVSSSSSSSSWHSMIRTSMGGGGGEGSSQGK